MSIGGNRTVASKPCGTFGQTDGRKGFLRGIRPMSERDDVEEGRVRG